MNSTLLVLGEAGAGKSTFINKLSGRECCPVSEKRNVDGTSSTTGPHYCTNMGINVFDTVGLSSKNFNNSVKDILEKVSTATQVAVLLVCRTSSPRWTVTVNEFRSATSLLFGDTTNVIVYWICDSNVSDEDLDALDDEMQEALGNGITCEFVDEDSLTCEELRAEIKKLCETHSNRIKHNAIPVRVASPLKRTTQVTQKPEKVETRYSLLSEAFLGRPRIDVPNTAPLVKALRYVKGLSADLLLSYKSRGDGVIPFELTIAAGPDDDVKSDVRAATQPSRLAKVYDILEKNDKELSSTPVSSTDAKSNLVVAAMWHLFETSPSGKKKKKKNPYFHLLRMIRNNKENTGDFENYVNQQSGGTEQTLLMHTILEILNSVAHEHDSLAYAQIGGSSKKRTNVSGVSDIDVYVHCKRPITQAERESISNQIHAKCNAHFGDITMEYHTNATTYENESVSFDVVFSDTKFSEENPKAPGQTEFYDNPKLQRVVRAFKIFQRESESFPKVKGICIERFVVSIAEREKNDEDYSGKILFVKCLKALASSNPAHDPRNINLQEWKSSAKILLATNRSLCGLDAVLEGMGLTAEFIVKYSK